MTSSEKNKLIVTNAGIWAIAILAAFIVPFIVESLASGQAKFVQVMCFAFPLIEEMASSSVVIGSQRIVVTKMPEHAKGGNDLKF